MFSDKVLCIFKNPKNAGRISKPDGIADNYSEDGSANVEFSLRVEDGIITDCKFKVGEDNINGFFFGISFINIFIFFISSSLSESLENSLTIISMHFLYCFF